jgi:hypothetical protein
MRPSQPPTAGVKTLTRVLYRMVQLTAICSSFLFASQCAPGQSSGREGAVDVPAQAPAGQTGPKTKLQGVDILSDTQGVDFVRISKRSAIKKFPPFPKAFSGPTLELRVRFTVNESYSDDGTYGHWIVTA